MATAFLIAIVAFVITARRREKTSPEEVPYKSLGKALIIISILFVLAVTPLSIDLAERRNPSPYEVTYNGVTAAEGFRVAIDYNCMGCHTIVGNGAYYAFDLVYAARRAWTPENIRALLEAYVGTPFMPFQLTERELDALTAWLLYLRDLNTNRWPPMKPVTVAVAAVELQANGEAAELYRRYCSGCHGVAGKPVVPGAPDFTNATWWEEELEKEGWEELIEVVLKGRGAMPGFANVLTEEQARAILEYARGFAAAPVKTITVGGFSFDPSLEENFPRWYESPAAWAFYWIFTTAMASLLIYLFLYWYVRG
jgi:nitric oxide reductase subunit C